MWAVPDATSTARSPPATGRYSFSARLGARARANPTSPDSASPRGAGAIPPAPASARQPLVMALPSWDGEDVTNLLQRFTAKLDRLARPGLCDKAHSLVEADRPL